jgi:pimeloyl-ACP methyl ester carboxylesterase
LQKYTVAIEEAVLDDLRSRLARTRLPDTTDGAGWSAGTDVDWLRGLLDEWAGFDWRAAERELNRLPMYRAELDGLRIHFVHQPGNGPRPLPLLLTHGWPSAFTEYRELLPLLTDPAAHGADPADAFSVVTPSLPGFGFSDRPSRPGVAHPVIADLWARLMTEVLGYRKFAAHGTDIGVGVTARLARQHPESLVGIHLSAASLPLPDGGRALAPAEQAYAEAVARWDAEEGAYARIHATRPQTLGVALNDSPAGLASWIVEKYRAWTDGRGDPAARLPSGYLPTLLTIYWATETAASSARLYHEYREHAEPLRTLDELEEQSRLEEQSGLEQQAPHGRVWAGSVPTGFSVFGHEFAPMPQPPRELAERHFNVTRWTEHPRGGHFPALEEPELLARDLREFFRPLRETA